MKSIHFICALFFVSLAWGNAQAIEKYPWTLGYAPDESIPYDQPESGSELKLHLFFPSDYNASDKRPCIIFFFGGGWNGGSPEQFYGYSKYFASRGMVAISAQYRTASSHKAKPSQCVEDGRQAIRYVRVHATELGIDAERIVVGGGSAGGHVAAACAMCPKIDSAPESPVSSIPNALVLFNPVYDNGPDGFGHTRVKRYWEDVSPIHNIASGLPPTIIFFGSKDQHAPVATIHDFQQKMDDAGNTCTTHIYEGQRHGFFHINKGGRVMFEDVLSKTDAFLVEQHFLSGLDTVDPWTAMSVENYKKMSKAQIK